MLLLYPQAQTVENEMMLMFVVKTIEKLKYSSMSVVLLAQMMEVEENTLEEAGKTMQAEHLKRVDS